MSDLYIIAGEDPDIGWDANWDGVVHTQLDTARESLTEAYGRNDGEYGYYAIYRLVPVDSSTEATQ